MEQTYCWNTEMAQHDAKYYPVHPQMSNFPNYTQPPNYNSSYSYNIPPPNVSNTPPLNMSSIPPPNVSNIPPDVNSTNSMYHFTSNTYHNEANFLNNVPYQNQMDPQCSNQYYGKMDPAHKQYMGENYSNWNMESKNLYNDNTGNEWHSNNSSLSWTTYAPAPQYDTSVATYDKERLQETQRMEDFKRKCDNREVPKRAISRPRSRSPHVKQEKVYKYDDHGDRYRSHSREVSCSRDSTYSSKYFEKSSSKKHGSYTSRSEGPYVSNRSRKRSKSREPHSSRDTTPTNNIKRTKGPTEREILLEKYR